MAMSRREMRIHLFELLFRASYYSSEEMDEQVNLFMDTMELLKNYDFEEDDTTSKMPYSNEPLSAEEEQQISDKLNEILAKLPEIDAKIESASENWKLNRMNSVDLNILRLATYEILFDETIPERVSINEAVEIAKIYGGEQSYSFINGILGKLIKHE